MLICQIQEDLAFDVHLLAEVTVSTAESEFGQERSAASYLQ
jgi:hypothetical protein